MSRTRPILRIAFCGADRGLGADDAEVATIPPLCRELSATEATQVANRPMNLRQGLYSLCLHKRRNDVANGFALRMRQGQIAAQHFTISQPHFHLAFNHF